MILVGLVFCHYQLVHFDVDNVDHFLHLILYCGFWMIVAVGYTIKKIGWLKFIGLSLLIPLLVFLPVLLYEDKIDFPEWYETIAGISAVFFAYMAYFVLTILGAIAYIIQKIIGVVEDSVANPTEQPMSERIEKMLTNEL